jgi:hypothetical protein
MNPNDRTSILRAPTGPAQSVAYTGTAGSITVSVKGTSIMVWCTTDAYICVGATATTTNGVPWPAYQPVWFPFPDTAGVQQGAPITVSAIQVAAGGTLYAKQFD